MESVNKYNKPFRKLFESLLIRYYKRKKDFKNLENVLYRRKFGKNINWKEPADLNQWISYLLFNTDISIWSLLADKLRVRSYLQNKGFGEYVVPLLAQWDNPEGIDFSNLPNQFILKMNNGSGESKIIKDKSTIKLEEIKQYFKNLYKKDYGKMGEIHYSKIKPAIIAEELLDASKQSFPSSSLIDYKVWCFNGKVECIFVCYDRTSENLKIKIYDGDWQFHREHHSENLHYIVGDENIPRPTNLEQMMAIASKLSEGFPQMRVDFYEVDDKLYIGEITMTSNGMQMQYFSDDYLKYLGKKCREAYLEISNN